MGRELTEVNIKASEATRGIKIKDGKIVELDYKEVKKDMMEFDAVSGASYSLQRFRLAMTIALMKAII